jgi:carboxylate-amine ligase
VLEFGPEFTLGIEEEYFLVDRATRDVVGDPPKAMLAELEALLGAQVSPEFLRSQIEIGTRICSNLDEARADLRRLRGTIASVAAGYGMAPIAAASHPFARWEAQRTTERVRYRSLESDLQGVRAICRASGAASRSAGCTSISASPTTSCASIC